jgi:DNA-binding NtrC family response regulator
MAVPRDKETRTRVVEKLLLVDDHQPLLDAFARSCRAAGKRALCARNKAEALAIARSETPDVAIVDLYLQSPDNGFDVVRELKAIVPDLFVIVVSADLTIDLAMRGRDAGADDCMEKPLRCQDLIARIESGDSNERFQLPEVTNTDRLLDHATRGFQRQRVLAALQRNNWNKIATAKELGISRQHVYDLMKQLDITPEKCRE